MRILFVGDVFGAPGRRAVESRLPSLREELAVDFCVVNGENAADGRGITAKLAERLLASGADWFAELLSPSVVRRQGYFDADTVQAMVRRQQAGAPPVHPHLDVDYLMLVATFAVFVDTFALPCLG